MNKLLIGLGAVIAVLVVIASSSLFIVEQTQQAIVLFFGKPQETIREPGLYVKVPFAEEVVYYEKRVLDLDPPKERMILADQKNIREVTLFPLTQNAQDLLMDAPSEISEKQLKELQIKTIKKPS